MRNHQPIDVSWQPVASIFRAWLPTEPVAEEPVVPIPLAEPVSPPQAGEAPTRTARPAHRAGSADPIETLKSS